MKNETKLQSIKKPAKPEQDLSHLTRRMKHQREMLRGISRCLMAGK
jgi:hypothetical protein